MGKIALDGVDENRDQIDLRERESASCCLCALRSMVIVTMKRTTTVMSRPASGTSRHMRTAPAALHTKQKPVNAAPRPDASEPAQASRR